MKLQYWNEETGKYDLMRQLQDMADARERNPDRKPPKMYYNFMQQKCYEQAAIVPPLKVFLGWTPMKEFIGKLGPAKFGIGKSVIRVEIKQSVIPLALLELIHEMNLAQLKFQKLMNDTLGIPKGKEDDER